MADVKYSPAGSVTPITNEPTYIDSNARAAMYQKLQLNQEQIDFLDPLKGKKFMTEFEIGNERIIMYGNPVYMSLRSNLIKSILEMDPPFQLASNITVLGGALMIVWLHINGVPRSLIKMLNLSLHGYFNIIDLINYLGVTQGDYYGDIMSDWASRLKDQIRGATVEELKSNAEQIANAINLYNQHLALELHDADVVEKIMNVEEIAKRLNYIPIILKYLLQLGIRMSDINNKMDTYFLGWIDAKKANNSEELVKYLMSKGYTVSAQGLLTYGHLTVTPTRQGNRIVLYDKNLLESNQFGNEVRSMMDKYRIAIPIHK